MSIRLEDFEKFWYMQLATNDCDPGIYMLKYIIQRMELNTEQKYWICWLYANTYQVATTWVLFNEFPDYENANVERIRDWNEAQKSRLPYQKDQKWLRGHLAPMFTSYKEIVGENQEKFFEQYNGNFDGLWNLVLKKFYKFGRYTGWMYLQALQEICGLDLDPPSLMLHHTSSWAHRAGWCRALGKDEWAVKGYAFSSEELKALEHQALDFLSHFQAEYGHEFTAVHANFYSMETSLCAFSKLFRTTRGRYLGYYLDRIAEDIHKTAKFNWHGINWDLLWESRSEVLLPEMLNNSVQKEQYFEYLENGRFSSNIQLLKRLEERYYAA